MFLSCVCSKLEDSAADISVDSRCSGYPIIYTWCFRVSARSGWPGGGALLLGEIASSVCNFCLSVAGHAIIEADLSLRKTFACCWNVKQPRSKTLC